MRLMLYAGAAPSRDAVIQFNIPIVQHVATSLTLVVNNGPAAASLLEDARERLAPPAGLPVSQRTYPGSARAAIRAATLEQPYDLVSFGSLPRSMRRLMRGGQGKRLARRLEPSVLRVVEPARPIRRILVSSGGDVHTFADVALAAQIARPLGATVTLLHIVSPQALVGKDRSRQQQGIEAFLQSDASEALTLRSAMRMLEQQGVQATLRPRDGLVLEEILSELHAGDYDLLVIGAHRVASALDRILLEDITGDLLNISPRSVLVVKSDVAGEPVQKEHID